MEVSGCHRQKHDQQKYRGNDYAGDGQPFSSLFVFNGKNQAENRKDESDDRRNTTAENRKTREDDTQDAKYICRLILRSLCIPTCV